RAIGRMTPGRGNAYAPTRGGGALLHDADRDPVPRPGCRSAAIAECGRQSGISGSSPQVAEPAACARPEPARFATENGEPMLALSVDRYASRFPIIVPT